MSAPPARESLLHCGQWLDGGIAPGGSDSHTAVALHNSGGSAELGDARRSAPSLGSSCAVSSRRCCTHYPPSKPLLSPLSFPSLVLPPSVPFRDEAYLPEGTAATKARCPLHSSTLVPPEPYCEALEISERRDSRSQPKMGIEGESVQTRAAAWKALRVSMARAG
jgi:hypothetical protein